MDWMDRYGFIRSMSKKGCSADNSACEGRDFKMVSMEEFMKTIDEYIN